MISPTTVESIANGRNCSVMFGITADIMTLNVCKTQNLIVVTLTFLFIGLNEALIIIAFVLSTSEF